MLSTVEVNYLCDVCGLNSVRSFFNPIKRKEYSDFKELAEYLSSTVPFDWVMDASGKMYCEKCHKKEVAK